MAGFQLSINGRFWVSTEEQAETEMPANAPELTPETEM
jgi:hypothetical protein